MVQGGEGDGAVGRRWCRFGARLVQKVVQNWCRVVHDELVHEAVHGVVKV